MQSWTVHRLDADAGKKGCPAPRSGILEEPAIVEVEERLAEDGTGGCEEDDTRER